MIQRWPFLLAASFLWSGYGVYTFLKFDGAGDRKALAAIKASKKLDDLDVEVTGEVKDDTIKVATLKILPSQD